MNVESVSFIAQTVNPLLLLFGLIPLLITMYLKLSKRYFVAIFLSLLFSLLIKETAILFIFLILLYSYFYLRKDFIKLLITTLTTIPIYSFLRFFVGGIGLATRPLAPIASLSFAERLLNVPAVIYYYIKTFFFPFSLAIDQHWIISNINFPDFYLPLLIDVIFFALLCFLGIYIYEHQKQTFKPYMFFFTWFVFGFLMIIQLFPLDQTVADRWIYLPMVGLLGLLGILYQMLSKKFPSPKIIIPMLLIIIILLTIRTIIRNNDWRNNLTLYNHDIRVSDNYDLENNLGNEYANKNDYADALAHLEKSVALRPYEYNLYNIGTVYENEGNFPKAELYYSMALNSKTYGTSLTHKHGLQTYIRYLYVLVFFNQNPPEAISKIQLALDDYPDSADLWQIMALAKYKIHDRQGALDAAGKAYRLNPDEKNYFILKHIQDNSLFEINIDNKAVQFN